MITSMSTDTLLDGVVDGTIDGAAPAVEPEPSSAAKPKKSRPKPKLKSRAAKVAEAPPAPATAVPKPRIRKAPSSGLPTDAVIYAAAVLIKQASDPTRIKILLLLGQRPRNVGEICDVIHQSQPATSHHLALGRHGGLWQPTRAGKNNVYGLTPKGEMLAKIVRGVFD